MVLAGRHQQFWRNFGFDYSEVLNVCNGKYAHARKKWNVLPSGVVRSL
jgi:hypothetical protein